MNIASLIHLMSMAVTTRLRHTALSATINHKLHTQVAPTSLLRQSTTPITLQMRTLLNRKAPITRTHSTILQTTLQKARTHLMNKPEVHMATATLL